MAAGLVLCIAWYYTIIAGFYVLYCPVMYFMFFHHKLYRKFVDTLFSLWELYPVALFQCCFGTVLHHYGDYVNPDEKTIIIMNHRTRIDWNYVWIALYHATQNKYEYDCCTCKKIGIKEEQNRGLLNSVFGGKSKIKFVLKDEIKHMPGMGWIMQLNYFLYLKRNWRDDQLNLSRFVAYYKRLEYPCRMVLFPEGTDLSEDNRRRNEKYAKANNLQVYEHVLHPRTTGWAVLCSRMRDKSLDSIYDVTVAYDKPAQTEFDLLCGKIPSHAYFHFKRYSVDELPLEEEKLRTWLTNCWLVKENNLRNYHNNGYFKDPISNKAAVKRNPRSLTVARLGFLFWTIIDIIFVYFIVKSILFRFWVTYHTCLFIIVTCYFGGFHNIQYKLLHNGSHKNC